MSLLVLLNNLDFNFCSERKTTFSSIFIPNLRYLFISDTFMSRFCVLILIYLQKALQILDFIKLYVNNAFENCMAKIAKLGKERLYMLAFTKVA